jgi:hypothetical protein
MLGNHPTAKKKKIVEMYANHENKKWITTYYQAILQHYVKSPGLKVFMIVQSSFLPTIATSISPGDLAAPTHTL